MTYEELKRIPYSFFKFMPKGRLSRDDVLINKDGAQTGKVGFYVGDFEEAAVNEHVFILRSRDQNLLDQHYLYYCLLLPETRNKIERRITGSAQPGLNSQFVKTVDIPFQALPQQKKIATILTSIDTVIEKTEALIAKYQQIKAGLMHDLFTRGVLLNGQLRPPREQAPELYQETAIGWIPREWETVALGSIADVARGKFTHRPRNDPAYYGGQHPFIQTGDVSASEGGIITTYSQTLSDLGATVSQRFPAETIAITIAANIADTGILGMPMYFPDSVVGAVVDSSANVRFVELCIRRSKRRLDAIAPQSAQKNINLQDLRPLEIPFPQRSEQDAIAIRIEDIQARIDVEAARREKLALQKSGLMHDLLTGKVPVKVDELAQEPA